MLSVRRLTSQTEPAAIADADVREYAQELRCFSLARARKGRKPVSPVCPVEPVSPARPAVTERPSAVLSVGRSAMSETPHVADGA